MDKLSQVRGVLIGIKNIAMQGIYAETFRGMEAQCVSTYRKCIATLKTVPDYEEIEGLAPELADNATMQEIGFAVETVLSLISEGARVTMGHCGPVIPPIPPMPHMRGMRFMRGPGRIVIEHGRRRGHRMPHGEHTEELQDEMREKMEEEQERFEDNIEELEDKMEELQEKIEEMREKLQERLEDIQEKYEEKIEELEEEAEEKEEEEEDEPKV